MTERRRRLAGAFRVEVAAALLIPAFVIGIPLLSDTSSLSASSGGPAAGNLAGPTATSGPFSTTSTTARPEDPPVAAAADSTFWDLLPGPSPAPTTGGVRTVPPSTTPSTSTPQPGVVANPAPATPGGHSPLRPAPASNPGPATTPTTSVATSVPRPPANLVLDFDSPSLVATWEAVSTNTDGTAFVGAYEIGFTAAGLSSAYTTIPPGFTYTLDRNQLDFGTPQAELVVTVRAVGVAGNRSGAVTAVATNEVPPIPTSPPVLVAGSTLVTVTAVAPPQMEDLAGFDIYHSTSPAGPYELLVSNAGTDAFTHAVPPGSTHHYLYKLRDVFGQVSPDFSPIATTTTS